MKKLLFYFVVFFLLFIIHSNPIWAKGEACMLYPVALEQKVDQSALIVEGKVLGQYSFWNDRHDMIYTSSLVKLFKVFKGNAAATEIEVITEGGTVGMNRIEFSSTLELNIDDNGIFFLSPHHIKGNLRPLNSYMVYGSMLGFVAYNTLQHTASVPFKSYNTIEEAYQDIRSYTHRNYRTLATNDDLIHANYTGNKTTATPTITSFAPTTISAGTGAILTITGTGFGALQGTGFVEFRNSHDGGATYIKPLASEYVSWSDLSISVKVPSVAFTGSGCAGTGTIKVTNSDPAAVTSAGTLTVSYAYMNIDDGGIVRQPRHVNDNGSGGYTWEMFTDFNADAASKAAFERMLSQWCNTDMNWTINPVASSIDVVASDGTNIVRYDNGAELPASVLGRCTSYWTACFSGGFFRWYVNELDICFDDAAGGLAWQLGPAAPTLAHYDFESVALHELGHGQQLNHVINAADVMHYALSNGDSRRVLNADDIAGGLAVKANSVVALPCGPTAMIAATCAPLPIELVVFSGVYADGKVQLHWETENEINVKGYKPERSRNGKDFTPIGYEDGNNAQGKLLYDFTDETPGFGKIYYRLRQEKLSGEYYYSKTIAINILDKNAGIMVFPNPAQEELNIISSDDLKNTAFILSASDGRVVRSFEFMGGKEQLINLTGLPPGVYFYSLKADARTYSGKIVKQ